MFRRGEFRETLVAQVGTRIVLNHGPPDSLYAYRAAALSLYNVEESIGYLRQINAILARKYS